MCGIAGIFGKCAAQHTESAYKMMDSMVHRGPEDVELAKFLTSQWHRGYIGAGGLTIRQAMACMSKCVFFLGNDAGTMHMAVSAGLKCVAIFSARDYPGKWDPYGSDHVILRKRVPCEGCLQGECPNNMKCIELITVKEVFHSCARIISGTRSEIQSI